MIAIMKCTLTLALLAVSAAATTAAGYRGAVADEMCFTVPSQICRCATQLCCLVASDSDDVQGQYSRYCLA